MFDFSLSLLISCCRRFVVLGANGYIGRAVAEALRAQGHSVRAVVRAESHRKSLEAKEIQVTIGSALDLEVVGSVVKKGDIVICSITSPDYDALNALVKRVSAAEGRMVYMGGCLDYGDHPNQIIDEMTVPNGYYADTRVQTFEQPCMDSYGMVVVRPGFVYGRSFGNYASKWFDINEGVTIDGNPSRMYGFIHIDDLAALTAALLDLPWATIQGRAFDVVDSTRLSYEDVRKLFAKTAGFTGEFKYTTQTGWPAGNISCLSRGERIQRYTGLRPRHGPLQDEIALGFKAFQNKE